MNEKLKLDNQLCFPLYVASKSIISLYTPVLSKYDLTYTQYLVMLVLFEEKDISVKDLGNRLYLDSGTLSPLIKKLENKGFLRKKRDKNDERSVVISLTKEGENMEQTLSEVPDKVASCLCLDREDAINLYKLLHRLMDNQNNK